MPKFRCGKSFGSVILLKNKKCGMVNKSVAWGIGEKEGRGKVGIVLKNKTKIQLTPERKPFCTQAFDSTVKSLSSVVLGCFVAWFILWITWQYALVDCE